MSNAKEWSLELGGDQIALILEDGFEFPWTHGRFVELGSFEEYRVYFSDEDAWPETEDFEALCQTIRARGQFKIRNRTTGELFGNVRLNCSGDRVWFRYS